MSKIEVVVKGPYHRAPWFTKEHKTKCWCYGMNFISYEAGVRLRVHVGNATREQLAELWLHQTGSITETIRLKDGGCDVVTTPINERFALGNPPRQAGSVIRLVLRCSHDSVCSEHQGVRRLLRERDVRNDNARRCDGDESKVQD